MQTKVITLVTFVSITLATTLSADSWGPPEQKEFFSPKQKHMLKVTPHKDWPNKPGHCQAILYKINGERKTEIWSRHLINNKAPMRVFVADSGKYVVTMDEHGSVGDIPVVIYGLSGELIRVHSTDSLGLKDDIKHIKQTVSSYWWNEDSISFFSPDEEVFFIRLHWGKLIFLELSHGDLMDEEWHDLHKGWFMPEKKWKALHEYVPAQIKKQVLQLLHSNKAQDRKTGALVCQQEKIESACPRLKKLLKDKEYFITNFPKEGTRVYFVRKAAKQALEALGQKVDGVVIEEPDKR